MKIPKALPQFKDYPTLFLVSGEFEAKFYVAKNGEISENDSFALNPREEAKEKQAFVGKKGGMQSFSAVSHHGRYIEDLKERFAKKLRDMTEDVSNKESIREIHVFAPGYVESRISKKISKGSMAMVKSTHDGQYLRENPLQLLEMMKKELEQARSTKHIHISKDEKKIMHRPNTKPKKG